MAASPRILIVTPEITYLPKGMGNMSNNLRAKAGGLADVSASLVLALFELGTDVHVALPHYRRMFHVDVGRLIDRELRLYKRILPNDRIHLAEDRAFYYQDQVYAPCASHSRHLALAFQREVINNILPKVNPDLLHCNDWMTGLVPASARRLGIPSLFTIHNIHTQKVSLDEVEFHGIDAAEFWQSLFFEQFAGDYGSAHAGNRIDLLASGIFASHFVNTVSPTFLNEVCDGRHSFVADPIRCELANKKVANCAFGILNAPDPGFTPETDRYLKHTFTADTVEDGKRRNKKQLQERLGLIPNLEAPIFFWPSRLDPVQKGCQLVAEALYGLVSEHWDMDLQVVFVANGPYQATMRGIVNHHGFADRVAVVDFDEELSHQGYAAADFILMPSLFEPCGLPQMISVLYGTLPIVHDTGGLHDTVTHLDRDHNTGNGFVFETYSTDGMWWGIQQALAFHRLPEAEKTAQRARIMRESAATFTHANTARQYIELYERMLRRPLTAGRA